jgi:hypothetical protein
MPTMTNHTDKAHGLVIGTLVDAKKGNEAASKIKEQVLKDKRFGTFVISHFADDDDPATEGDVVAAMVDFKDEAKKSPKAHEALEQLMTWMQDTLKDSNGDTYFQDDTLKHY